MSNLIFDKYEIIRRLALGGMGEVFLAREKSGIVDRLVILKSLLPELAEQEGFIDQFLDEARVAAGLNHPNIVSIYEVGLWHGVYFIAMEHIHGSDLSKLQRAAGKKGVGLPFQVSARIVLEAALGLHHAHEATDVSGNALNIVHRDISPQNIMVRGDGVTKVVDFGIAKASNRETRTATGLLKGKLQYMPPEQVRGEELDGRSDQFSLGVVLWEMCTGKRLFKAENELETLKRVLNEPIPLPTKVVNGFPEQLEGIIMKMLARDPDDRYPNCAAVADHLKSYLDSCTRQVGQQQVSAFVKSILAEELSEVTRNLQPSKDNFIIALGESGPHAVSAGQEPVATPTANFTSTFAFQLQRRRSMAAMISLGLVFALVVGGVLAWASLGGDEAEPPPDLPPVVGADTPAVEDEAKPAPPEAGPARLSLSSEPKGASVWLDGRMLGKTPFETDKLPPGMELVLELEKKFYEKARVSLRLNAGELVEKHVELEKPQKRASARRTRRPGPTPPTPPPSPPPKDDKQEDGHLTLNTTPWSKVSIDGQPYGSTPVFKVRLSPGTHTVVLENENLGLKVTKKVTIAPGKTLRRNWKLQ